MDLEGILKFFSLLLPIFNFTIFDFTVIKFVHSQMWDGVHQTAVKFAIMQTLP